MRKTKIICTIGPASSDEQVLTEMFKAGMNVARLNFSHGTHDEHLARINTIKKVRKKLNMPVAIMLDTKGPEYRIGTFKNGSATICGGDEFCFTTRDVDGDEKQVAVSYKGLCADLDVGDHLFVNNGMVPFEVIAINDTDVICRALIGGELSDRKSMSFPGKVLKHVYMSDQDKRDILFGIENDVDFIACSFVSCKQDLMDVHEFMEENGAGDIDLIAKIENQSGVDNIDEICEACGGIMIGRGDLGVEIPFEDIPAIQKYLITRCRLMGKRVITATEMLESMIYNPRPTRAETSDVANAVYDGASAIMLSGETAAGKYPVLAVDAMARIAEHTERNIDYKKQFMTADFRIKDAVDALSHATCGIAIDLKARVIAVCTLSGITARMVSRFRSPVDIMGLTTNEKTWRKLAMSWGVTPVICDVYESTDVLFYTAKKVAVNTFDLKAGDMTVITGGMTNGISGNTNIIKVEMV